MFKLVVLCAFVAAAVAEPEPQVLYPGVVTPYAAYSTVVSPASTSISSQSSSVIHPSPIYGSTYAFPHFIKKRSPQFLAPAFNAPFNYYPAASYVPTTSVLQTPITYSGAALPLATPVAHLIKKRSADPQFIAPSYYESTYVSSPAITAPVVTSPYVASPYYSSAALPLLSRTVYSAPTATIPLATHLIKKRSADPQLQVAVPAAVPTAYYGGSPFYPAYTPAATLIKSSPIISANPFVYSTFIKK